MIQIARDICMDREECLHKTHSVLTMEYQAIVGDMEVDMLGDTTTAINCLFRSGLTSEPPRIGKGIEGGGAGSLLLIRGMTPLKHCSYDLAVENYSGKD
jgi:hypothetical protein